LVKNHWSLVVRNFDQDDTTTLRRIVSSTVRRLEPICGSRMLAYEKVAAAVGVSASWLRKFITVEGTTEPRWSVGCALTRFYDSLCDDLDRRTESERKEITKLIEEINEATRGSDAVVLPVFLPKRSGRDEGGHQV
jgi:hypothetical protein